MNLSFSRIVIASANRGKVAEFAQRFAMYGVAVESLADYPQVPPVVEDGDTFAANAEKKARSVAAALGVPALAADSGLCVDALDGRPGVWSARFAGEGASDQDNIAKLLQELRQIGEHRQDAEPKPDDSPSPRLLSPASFVCALALFDPVSGALHTAEGKCSGWIIDSPRGSGGFGYDPVFYLPQFGRTMAELDVERKNAISHRGHAMDQLLRLFGA